MKLIVTPSWKMDSDIPDVLCAVIQICDPLAKGRWLSSRWSTVGHILVKFADVRWPDHDWRMLDRHAEEIWKFVRESINTAAAIVVSCDAGVSRSPSVAMAIVDHYKLGREAIEWCGRDANGPPPNEWVYDTMMRNAEVA